MQCYNCCKRGHVKIDCWANGGDKEGQRPKGKGGKARAVAAVSWATVEVQRADEDDWVTGSTKNISGSGIETDESDAERSCTVPELRDTCLHIGAYSSHIAQSRRRLSQLRTAAHSMLWEWGT